MANKKTEENVKTRYDNKKENKFLNDIVRDFARKENITIGDSDQLIKSFLRLIEDTVSEGHDVMLTGFGKFYLAKRAPGRTVHPVTKESMTIPASKSMSFKVSDKVKNRINGK